MSLLKNRRLPQILIVVGMIAVAATVSDAGPTGYWLVLGIAGYVTMVAGCIWIGLIWFRHR
jgi:ABC-type uncharacterized transport system permease subunit